MVGLFKKLGKKKKRSNKNIHSASEDESATEDESYDRLSYLNSRNSRLSTTSNGLELDTPKERKQSAVDGSCSETDSLCRNSYVSSISSTGSQRRVSFDVDDVDVSLAVEDSEDNDDAMSVTSADEGSLFGEDVLSAFQDGHLSLQQFLQSPHLSRCEDRIVDEELDSMFSDSRSVESSNFYSDSSSEGDKTDERDKELDRIAGELFGDYGEKFLNPKDPRSTQKTPYHADGYKTNRDSYCSIGNETITNSCNDLTVCSDPADKNITQQPMESANSSSIIAQGNKIIETRNSPLSKVSVQLSSSPSTASSITFPSPSRSLLRNKNKDIPSLEDLPPSKNLPPAKENPPVKENLPIKDTSQITDLPRDQNLPPVHDLQLNEFPSQGRDLPPTKDLPPKSLPLSESDNAGSVSNAYTSRRLRKITPENLPISPISPSPTDIQHQENHATEKQASAARNERRNSLDGISMSPTNATSSRSKTPIDNLLIRAKTPIDRAFTKSPISDHLCMRADTPSDLQCSRASPIDNTYAIEASSCANEAKSRIDSRPCSTTSSSSQREVAIVDNTVISLQGNYVISSEKSNQPDTLTRGKSPHPAEKVDPWLSYLPSWKTSACNSVDNSPSRSVRSDNRCGSRLGDSLSPREDGYEAGCEASEEGSRRPSSVIPNDQANLSDQDRYIRFSSLQLDFFIPPPPAEEDAISTAQENQLDATPFNLEWEYEISESPTLTPSSSVIFLGNKEKPAEEIDPIAESLLGLLPISNEQFQSSVSTALGEIITEIVSSRQKFSRLNKTLETQERLLKEQRKEIKAQAREISELKAALATKQTARTPTSPRVPRRNEFKSYPETGRRSKELVDLENTLDKLLFQCHTLQRNSATDPDLQVFQPIESSDNESCDLSMRPPSAAGSEVKTLLHKRIPESPANHVQIVPAKGVVYNSCKETKEDLNAIEK